MNRWLGIGAVVIAAVLWGTSGTVQASLSAAREPLAVGAIRLAVGAFSILMLALAQPRTRAGLARLPWRGVFLAGAAIGAYNLLFFRAVSEAGVGLGTAVTIGSAPLWATAWEGVALGRWPGGARAAGLSLALAGLAVPILAGGSAAAPVSGLALAAAAGACYATYSLATSRMGSRAPSTSLAAATFGVAALLTAPVLVLVPLDWIGPADLGALAFLGVAATGLSYALYTWGLTRVAASTAVTLALAEPVTAWLLALTVVGEPATAAGVIGVALILTGLAVVAAVPARGR